MNFGVTFHVSWNHAAKLFLLIAAGPICSPFEKYGGAIATVYTNGLPVRKLESVSGSGSPVVILCCPLAEVIGPRA